MVFTFSVTAAGLMDTETLLEVNETLSEVGVVVSLAVQFGFGVTTEEKLPVLEAKLRMLNDCEEVGLKPLVNFKLSEPPSAWHRQFQFSWASRCSVS